MIGENGSRRIMYGDVVLVGRLRVGGVNVRTLETGTGMWVRVKQQDCNEDWEREKWDKLLYYLI